MSVSDPLIKDIKAQTLKLHKEFKQNDKINDSSATLQRFCELYEAIFMKGFIQYETRTFYGIKTVDLYSLLWKLSIDRRDLSSYAYANIFDIIRDLKNVRTSLGKFRLLVRHCLVKKCIEAPLEFLSGNLVSLEYHYQRSSIIGDEILSAILLSVLLQCNKIDFDLNLYNYAFLDYSWDIPILKRFQLVPCDKLGIGISFTENKAVIVNIHSNSVVAEEEVAIGDVLDNLNGVEIDSSAKGRLNHILKLRKGLPIDLVVVKSKKNGEIYAPIKKLLDNLKFDLEKINKRLTPLIDKNKSGYKATYLGCLDVGNNGTVKKIHSAIKSLTLFAAERKSQEILFDIGEIDVKITDLTTSQVILNHSYMQISSCGSVPNLSKYFAYIAGEENCDTAQNFTCYVFYTTNPEEASMILTSIGQGFYRTHFAV